jgi:hypothetical protein
VIRFLSALVVSVALPLSALAQAPAGNEFQVNTYTTSFQYGANGVASDGSGNFVVVWPSNGQDGSDYGIFGQRFSAAGVRLGIEFQVNTYTTNRQYQAAVASDANGNFVVVWQSYGPDGHYSGVFGQRFNALGVRQGSEFRVNTYTTHQQIRPAVSADASGNFVVVWDSFYQDGNAIGVFGQRFDAAGVPQGSEFRVNSYTTDFQYLPAVASAPGGSFLVVWTSLASQDGDGAAVMGQRFNAAGVRQGSEFRINTYTTSAQFDAAVSADGNGNFVVVWSSPQDDSGPVATGIVGRRVDAAGVLQGSEFQVNTYTTSTQSRASVASDAHGNFVVAWESFGQDVYSYGIFGQRFDASGTRQGAEFPVNSYTFGNQLGPAVASGSDGDFVVVWGSDGQDGSSFGMFGQRYGDMIFEDGFDSGSLFRWSSSSTDGGDLSPSGAAAMGGTGIGLQAVVDDTNSLFVQDDTPNAESRYRVRFYVDTNGFDPGEASSHFRTRLFIANSSAFRLVTIVLKRQLGAYTIEARVRRNDGTRADTGFFPIAGGPHFVEFDWQRSTGPGASNGSLQFWIDGVSVTTLSGIDNDQESIELGRMGALAVKTGAAGTLFFDQFESRRQRLIGAE